MRFNRCIREEEIGLKYNGIVDKFIFNFKQLISSGRITINLDPINGKNGC
ncbi:hypothetical protein [Clostridium sp.]|nr:hypothetical protein [Clostridium sp.]MBK5243211.1 hypothetical protein [Clostridium sp.]